MLIFKCVELNDKEIGFQVLLKNINIDGANLKLIKSI